MNVNNLKLRQNYLKTFFIRRGSLKKHLIFRLLFLAMFAQLN